MKTYSMLVAVALLITTGCASSENEKLEGARFALDSGDFSSAITKASEVLSADTTNIEAALLLSAAYAGRGGIKILTVTADIMDATGNDSDFSASHTALLRNINATTGLSDLRAAIETLDTTLTEQPADTHALFSDHQFQLGMLETIEAFGLPSITAKASGEERPTTSRIDDTGEASTANTDFIRADDHLINGGFAADDTLVVKLRQNYCALENAAGGAFSAAALRDQILCQLTPSNEQDALTSDEGNFETGLANCSGFDFDTCDTSASTN